MLNWKYSLHLSKSETCKYVCSTLVLKIASLALTIVVLHQQTERNLPLKIMTHNGQFMIEHISYLNFWQRFLFWFSSGEHLRCDCPICETFGLKPRLGQNYTSLTSFLHLFLDIDCPLLYIYQWWQQPFVSWCLSNMLTHTISTPNVLLPITS